MFDAYTGCSRPRLQGAHKTMLGIELLSTWRIGDRHFSAALGGRNADITFEAKRAWATHSPPIVAHGRIAKEGAK